jgi:uncharacterized phage protein (TIGR01671 family)
MSREIKFRAWYKNNGVMTKGFILQHLLETAHNQSGLDWEQAQSYDEIMQYTGLKDKNGKEIYEGDVVTGRFGILYEVKYGEFSDTKAHAQIGYYLYDIEDEINIGNIGYDCDELENPLEIIGNIYDNPELINN